MTALTMDSSSHFWRSRKAVGLWLALIAVIILAMVSVGGLTRLTGSGLSITQWDPIMGVIPPISDQAWQQAFEKYQRIPQYIHENQGMSLSGFKGIFWWEWAHRLLGRLLGVIFLVPFLLFAWTGAIARRGWPRMIVLFALGSLQGFVGWWMVESGLETRLSVSQYRLAIHLGVALLLLVAILWTALEYLRQPSTTSAPLLPRGPSLGVVLLIYLQMLLGALVAGLHGGLLYNTWPSMNGRFLAEDALAQHPWWLNLFENPAMAQFDHRIGAYIVVAAVLGVLWWEKRQNFKGLARRSGVALLHVTLLQIVLGIVTLLWQAPEALAACHQLLAALLLCTAVWHAFESRKAYPIA